MIELILGGIGLVVVVVAGGLLVGLGIGWCISRYKKGVNENG